MPRRPRLPDPTRLRWGVVHEDRVDPAAAGANSRMARLAWFVALWAASVGGLALVGLAIKIALGQ